MGASMICSPNSIKSQVEHHLVPVEGGEIWCIKKNTESLKPNTPIIVLHGGPGLDCHYLSPFLEYLPSQHDIILYDQRGSTNSSQFSITRETIHLEQFVKDLDRIREYFGYDVLNIIGHSFGGLLGMHYALQNENKVNTLTLLSSAPATSVGLLTFELTRKIRKQSAILNNFLPILTKGLGLRNNSPYEFPHSLSKHSAKVMDCFTQTCFSKWYDLRSQLKNLNVPTLIIHGKKDAMPLWTAEELTRSLPNSNLKILCNSGHYPFWDDSTECFSILRTFLSHHHYSIA
jgi:proline iminopeptidase